MFLLKFECVVEESGLFREKKHFSMMSKCLKELSALEKLEEIYSAWRGKKVHKIKVKNWKELEYANLRLCEEYTGVPITDCLI